MIHTKLDNFSYFKVFVTKRVLKEKNDQNIFVKKEKDDFTPCFIKGKRAKDDILKLF